ncbi:hypothetical protein DPMN_033959 [Dreissena polymorpha]|uniref:Ferric-chelate reductase 1 n=1 Tax=Dreissena polymorpha TaxID=45954 RepID=A0A9D4M6M8_DREPO|nr:hypothetical protein DPMN_033959 [Dreissena polymorpha]
MSTHTPLHSIPPSFVIENESPFTFKKKIDERRLPPRDACNTMVPAHGVSAQTGANPYRIVMTKATYSPSENIQVSLQGIAGVGNPCDLAAATHQQTGNDDKPSINLTWTAPDTNVGSIVFVYTVVQQRVTFWVKQQSANLTYQASGSGNPVPTQASATATSTTSPTTSIPTTTLSGPIDKINQPAGCGNNVSCIMPRNCSQNCQYSVQWRPSKNNTVVEFEVKRKTSSPNYYMALGFSEDLQMGRDSVAQCVTLDGRPNTLSSYNADGPYKSNTNLDVATFGITMLAGQYKNGVLTCTFERRVNVLSGSPLRNEDSRFFDLSYPYFLLIAHGTAYDGTIEMHSETPDIYSAEKIDFLGGAKLYDWTTKTPSPPDTQTGEISRPSDCGKVYSCFHDGCKGGNCDFMLTWKETGDDILFSLTCKRPQNAYCAIGLSKDNKMGDDSVFECVANGDQVIVSLSYNDGRSNSRLEQPQFGLTDVTTSSKDGVISCTFKRKKVAPSNTGRKKRAAEGPTTFFNLNEDFTLFYAYGSASSGFLMKHSVTPLVSDQVADFQAIQEIGGTSTKITLIKVHGILMVIAWMLLASFGIFSARFYKDVWPEGFEWCSQKRWFVIHRACMVTVFLLTAASFVVIFVYVKGYAQITGSNFEKSHPIIGIVVMALTLINPIMALFRPHPGTPKRPIFNVAHTLVGVAAHACSITNIFSGTALAASRTPGYVRIILWVYVGWLCVVDLVCHIYGCYNKTAKKASAYELKNVTDGPDSTSSSSQGVKSFKIWVLALQGIVLLGLSLAVIISVALGDNDNM